MSNLIRVSGLVLFFVIMAIVSGVYLLFADKILTSSIVEIGTEIVGAKVELEQGEINLDELVISLTKLAVTNPNAPMKNAFEAEQIHFNLNSDALVWKKTIIDELSIENLRLDTLRSESGAIDSRVLSLDNVEMFEQLKSVSELSNIELPDAKDIVDSAQLETLEAIDQFKVDVQTLTKQLQADYQALPNQTSIEQYKQQLAKIKNSKSSGNKMLGLFGKGKELKSLQKTIKNDLKLIKNFKNKVSKSKDSLTQQIRHIKTLPQKDLERLTSQYSVSGNGLSNMAGTVFGPQLEGWIKEGMIWYQRISPLLNQVSSVKGNETLTESSSVRRAGRDILFPDHINLPDNLIKLISITSGSADSEAGITISGKIQNLTTQPQRWNKPLSFELNGKAGYFEQVTIEGVFDHRQLEQFNDQFSLKLQHLSFKKLALKKSSQFADDAGFKPTAGYLDVISSGTITNNSLNIELKLLFSKAQFELSPDSVSSPLLEKIRLGLAQIDNFEILVSITGSFAEPSLSIKAPGLYSLATKIAGQAVSGKLEEFKSQLTSQLLNRTSSPLSTLGGELGQLSSIEALLGTKQSDFQSLLKDFL